MISRRVLACLVTGMLATAYQVPSTAKRMPLTIGQKVPDFSITDLTGKTRRLSDLQKSTPSGAVSLTFWCSFCHSCRDMEDRLNQLSKEWRGKAAVAAIDSSAGETADRVRAFARSKELTMPILLDNPGRVADLFGVHVTTTTVLIDGKGILRYRGQFARGQHAYAEDALKAVVGGKTVSTPETAPHG